MHRIADWYELSWGTHAKFTALKLANTKMKFFAVNASHVKLLQIAEIHTCSVTIAAYQRLKWLGNQLGTGPKRNIHKISNIQNGNHTWRQRKPLIIRYEYKTIIKTMCIEIKSNTMNMTKGREKTIKIRRYIIVI